MIFIQWLVAYIALGVLVVTFIVSMFKDASKSLNEMTTLQRLVIGHQGYFLLIIMGGIIIPAISVFFIKGIEWHYIAFVFAIFAYMYTALFFYIQFSKKYNYTQVEGEKGAMLVKKANYGEFVAFSSHEQITFPHFLIWFNGVTEQEIKKGLGSRSIAIKTYSFVITKIPYIKSAPVHFIKWQAPLQGDPQAITFLFEGNTYRLSLQSYAPIPKAGFVVANHIPLGENQFVIDAIM